MSQARSFCVDCGHQLGVDAAFCDKCGAPVSGRTPPSTPPKAPILPPLARVPSGGSQPQVESTEPVTATSGPSWLMPVVGLALVVVLMGVGVKLLKGQAKTGPSAESSGSVALASTSPSSPAEAAPGHTPSPQIPLEPPALAGTSAEDEIPGLEPIPLDRAESYLPLPRARYRHSMKYPDGDQGHREMVVAASGDARVTTVIEFTHSKLYPDDPPGLWVNHYVARPDGVYRYSDDEPQRAELWLPNDLALGKTWSNTLGDFEVTAFDQALTVNAVPFQGVLAYRHRSSALDLDQTIWLGLGHGEIQGRYGEKGEEFFRLLQVEPEPESRLEELMKRHVVNRDKLR